MTKTVHLLSQMCKRAVCVPVKLNNFMSENNLEEKEIIETEVVGNSPGKKSWLITAAIIGLIGLLGVGWIVAKQFSVKGESASEEKKEGEHGDEHGESAGKEVKLESELLASANIETEGVTARPAVSLLNVTGTIESNPQQNSAITSLVSGKVEQVYVSIGDRVSAGQTIATLLSTEIGESYGKWREAETRLDLARKNVTRVQSSANRVAVLQAKARFDEAQNNLSRTKELVKLNSSKDLLTAESAYQAAKARFNEADAALKRTKKIVELGAGAGKDLIAAETNFKTAKADLDVAENNVSKIKDFVKIGSGRDLQSAETMYQTTKAEYDFQKNIPLTKEFQEAQSDLKIAEVDANHQKQSLQALGVNVTNINVDVRNVASIPIKATLSGVVAERMVNNGSGVQAGQEMLKLSNVSSVWVTANVPENQLRVIQVGTIAEIKTAAFGEGSITARVTNIDTMLNEDTRTAKVRLAVDNPGERLKAGMFAEIGFRAGTASGEEIVVKSNAVQRIDGKDVVFVPVKDEPGAFNVREVEIDGEIDGYTRIKKGLEIGESVVTKGSFTLKSVAEKGELGEHGH
jgi:membrane fusion protein, heavy metal efflux system